MKIILKTDVHHLGRAGDILKVKNGFARNFLFPQKLALPAEAGSLKEAQHKQQMAQARARHAQLLRDQIAEKIKDCHLVFHKKASKNGKLFGSVTSSDIALLLKDKEFDVDKKFIQLMNPIKSTGDFTVSIDLGQKTRPEIKISVLSEEKKEVQKESLLNKFKQVTSKLMEKKTEPSSEEES